MLLTLPSPVCSLYFLYSLNWRDKQAYMPLYIGLSLAFDQERARDRLGICQKIYTTQFSGERILHTENA